MVQRQVSVSEVEVVAEHRYAVRAVTTLTRSRNYMHLDFLHFTAQGLNMTLQHPWQLTDRYVKSHCHFFLVKMRKREFCKSDGFGH